MYHEIVGLLYDFMNTPLSPWEHTPQINRSEAFGAPRTPEMVRRADSSPETSSGNPESHFEKNDPYDLELRRELSQNLSLGFVGTFSSEGRALAFFNRTRKWGYVTRNGKELSPDGFDGGEAFSNGMAAVFVGRRYFFIDASGKNAFHNSFEFAANFHEGLARVKGEQGWMFVDLLGKELSGEVFEDAEDFHDGLAQVKRDGKWFYINRQGQELSHDRFDSAGSFCEGVARVQQGSDSFYIDLHGKRVFASS